MLKREIQSHLRAHDATEEELSSFVNSQKKVSGRISIPKISPLYQNYEEEFCQRVQSLCSRPCLIQFHHPSDEKHYGNVKNLMNSFNEQKVLWSAVLAPLSWISVRFTHSEAVISADYSKLDSKKLEESLKTISYKSESLIAFNIQKENEHFSINLKLGDQKNVGTSNERENRL